MTLTELIDLANDFGQKVPNYRGVPTRKDSIRQLNRALRIVGRALDIYDPNVSMSVRSGVSLYNTRRPSDFGKMLWRVDSVHLAGAPLRGPQGVRGKVWSLNEFQNQFPYWRNDPAGQTQRAVQWNSETILLHQTPDADTAGMMPNSAAGFIFPGAVLGDGGYSSRGFPTDDAGDTGGVVTATVYSTFASAAALSLPTGGTLTGTGNTTVADAAVMAIAQTYPLIAPDPDTTVGLYNHSLAVPADATINWVRVENCKMGSATNSGLQIIPVVDATDIGSGSLGLWTANPNAGATLTEAGPGPNWTGIDRATLMAATFGLKLSVDPNPGTGPLSGNFAIDVDYIRIAANYTVDALASGAPASTIDYSAEPDIPWEGHEILAYAAAYLAGEPSASDQAVLTQIALYDKRWRDWIRETAAENRRALSPVDDDPTPPWGVRFGR